jgi:hypothetical protein
MYVNSRLLRKGGQQGTHQRNNCIPPLSLIFDLASSPSNAYRINLECETPDPARRPPSIPGMILVELCSGVYSRLRGSARQIR